MRLPTTLLLVLTSKMPFDRRADVDLIKTKIEDYVLKIDAKQDPSFELTFDPTFKYAGKKTRFSKWMTRYANGGPGNYDEAMLITEHYVNGLNAKNIPLWNKPRHIGKTMCRIRTLVTTDEWEVTEEDVLKCVLLTVCSSEESTKWITRKMSEIEWPTYD